MKEIREILDYIRARGFLADGEVAYQSELRFLTNGAFLTEQQLRSLALYESCKDEDAKDEDAKPDALAIQDMANACLRIAQHPAINSIEADEGREIFERFEEWKNTSADVPVAQLRVLVKRMAYYLTRNFGYLWPESVPQLRSSAVAK
jgi:hypothetical protein